MEEIRFQVDLSVSELYVFSMRHTYCSASGVFGLLLSFGSLAVCALRYESLDGSAKLALLIIGLLFTVVQPIMLYGKAFTQRQRNKDINATLQYCISEEGIQVSQGEQQVQVLWYDVRKMVQSKHAVYLYMSPVRAFIFPRRQCGNQYDKMISLIRSMLEKYKDYEMAEGEMANTQESGSESTVSGQKTVETQETEHSASAPGTEGETDRE